MTELIKIIEKEGERLVDARELHEFLEIGKRFASWITDRIDQYDLVENRDYIVFPEIGKNPFGGKPSKEYALTLDTAKELSMVERNEKGKLVRQYFIDCEKRYKEIKSGFNPNQLSRMDILKLAMQAEEENGSSKISGG